MVYDPECEPCIFRIRNMNDILFLSYDSTAQFWALAASMKLPFHFGYLRQSAGPRGRVISSSQGLC
jgi:hypothetical protein